MQIGYSLIDGSNSEVKFWGGVPGVCPGVPNPLVLPNGDVVEGVAATGQYGDWRLVERHWALGTSSGVAWDGNKVMVTEPVTAEMVQAERARRLAAGFAYTFPDIPGDPDPTPDPRGTIQIGTTPADMIGWDAVTQLAGALVAIGNTSAEITITPQDGPVIITAMEWQSILVAAAQFQQPIWAASFALQAMSPIPADYATNESYWAS